jgi:hypothetical protein
MRQATLLLGNLFILNCKQLVSSLGHFQQNSCLLVEKPKIALGKLCLGWMSSVARDTSGSLLWLPHVWQSAVQANFFLLGKPLRLQETSWTL